ncbi:glycosyltransferase [Vibrio vulnificus]|nr:glycosyltransferase [Vibrio vulnificus]
MKKILIHYPFIPIYRVPIFNEFGRNQKFKHLVIAPELFHDKTFHFDKTKYLFNWSKSHSHHFSILGRGIDIEWGILSNLWAHRAKGSCYVILSNPNILSSWLYSICARILGYKVVFWGHGLIKKDTGITRFIRKLYYSLADHFWLYGNDAIPLMRDIGISDDKLSVIYNSLDYEVQRKLREKLTNQKEIIKTELGIDQNEKVIVSMGRLLEKIRLDQGVNGIHKIINSEPNVKLVVIGDGPEKDSLIALTKELDIESKVLFVGAIYNESDIARYYTIADVSIVMGRVGLSAMHSLAYGVPLITHDNLEEHCPEVEAIVPGETGEFFQENNIDSFVCVLLKLLKNSSNYRNNCVSMIEDKYTPSKQMEFIEESLSRIK